jgi:hypothetical protein
VIQDKGLYVYRMHKIVEKHFLFSLIIHTYHSRFIPEGVAEVYQIFLRDTHVLPKLVSYENTADVTDGKPIAVLLQSN